MKALGRLWTFYATALVLGVVLAALYHTGWLSSLDFLPSSVRSSDTSQASTHSPALWGVAKAYAHHEALDAEPLIVQLRRDALASGVQPSIDMSRALGKHLRQGLVMTGATPHRLILFSFDDGPDRHITPKLLDQLDQYGIRALFFLTAMRIRGDTRRSREQAEIAREIVRRGHVIGNHSVDHPQMPTLGNPDVRYQIETSTRIFERVLGARPWLFRPPGGARSERVDRMIEERGYTIAMWNLGTGDTQVRDAQGVFGTWKRVLSRLEREEGNRGGIVLLHDIHPWSLDAFRMIE